MHGPLRDLLRIGNCNFSELVNITCSSGDECRDISDLKSGLFDGVTSRAVCKILLCPCDQNLKTQFCYVCNDRFSSRSYDILILVPKRSRTRGRYANQLVGECFLVEIKKVKENWTRKHFTKIKRELEDKFYASNDCTSLCDIECVHYKRIWLTSDDLPRKHKEQLERSGIVVMDNEEFIEEISKVDCISGSSRR